MNAQVIFPAKAKRLRAGPQYSKSLWSYRGILMTGTPPRHGWGSGKGMGSGWTWRAEVGRGLVARRKSELMALIDTTLAGAA